MDSAKFLKRGSVTLPEERPNRLVKDGKVDITTILGIHLYRHGHVVFCKGCRVVLGRYRLRRGGAVGNWHPWWCECSNYDFLLRLDYNKEIRKFLLASERGRANGTFDLSEGSGGIP